MFDYVGEYASMHTNTQELRSEHKENMLNASTTHIQLLTAQRKMRKTDTCLRTDWPRTSTNVLSLCQRSAELG